MKESQQGYISQEHKCERCGNPIRRKPYDTPSSFLKRRFCGYSCSNKTRTFTRVPMQERFWCKVKIGAPTECWEWKAAVHPDGYGWFTGNPTDRPRHAHRFAYQLSKGDIPDNLWVLHTCDNRICVNPNHLYLGNRRDNIKDCVDRNRTCYGERNPRSKLTEKQVVEIRQLRRDGVKQATIASVFGIAQSCVSQIEHRQRWKRAE